MEDEKLNISIEDRSKNIQTSGSKLVVKLNIPADYCNKDEESIEQSQPDGDLQVSKESLLEQIKIVQEELEHRKQHTERIAELSRAVEEWKADFAKALEKIQDTFAFVK
uniref:Uncharacterized protein n=1 Tax=Bactrocera latifrons TaxID=174628 RepID=A0A0K8UBL3_BACLA